MDATHTAEVSKHLEEEFRRTGLHRPLRVKRYEAGAELTYNVTGVADGRRGTVRLLVEEFVGGGFAGQVYRVEILDVRSGEGPLGGLRTGGTFAMKILTPARGFHRFFRNVLYGIGFQGPFQPQVSPAAARCGAIWQKLIRRGAGIWFGDERCVTDIHATFVDHRIGSCGDLSEWIDGRTWRLEVDDHVDLLGRWARGKTVDRGNLGSPEYRAKHEFMHRFVELLHEMGGYEFARQYEWSTWKSQPNCLKRWDAEDSPSKGLVAVDFRAGLALLPFLPMSPGDFKLIAGGFKRGSLVQFDRGNLAKLQGFIDAHAEEMPGAAAMMRTLRDAEEAYRSSLPDVTHHHVRLLYDPRLWSSLFAGAVTGWKTRNFIEDKVESRLRDSRCLTLLFWLAGLIPFLGVLLRRVWGQTYWRKHYGEMLTSWSYSRRAVRGALVERLIDWHRAGRIDDENARLMVTHAGRAMLHIPLSIFPVGVHRFFTDWGYARDRLDRVFARPLRLYFNAALREQWLRDMVMEGRENHLLSEHDAQRILSRMGEPFIQKYLKSLAVHVCTLPVTQLVSVALAIVYVLTHPETPRAEAWGVGIGIIALFQVLPVSPGSLVRGLYVVYLVARERNFKDYNIAVFIGFLKYLGYLAFPIQMAYRYPTLARFMATNWATGAVHAVPVFGERGALLEHWVFRLCYNWPLTLRRRMRRRAEIRMKLKPRYWPMVLCGAAVSLIFGLVDYLHLVREGTLPNLKDVWALAVILPLFCGAASALWMGGVRLAKRVAGAVVCGAAVGLVSTAASAVLGHGAPSLIGDLAVEGPWRISVFSVLSAVGTLLTEITSPEPD